jgi:Holliday junction resolvase RusA-like endonuclease
MNAHSPLTVGDVEIPAGEVPFLMPTDRVLTVDLPPPLSVNKTRKINWAAKRKVDAWIEKADMQIMSRGGMRRIGKPLAGSFEVTISFDETLVGLDLDNAPKLLIDYCRRLGLVRDDSPRYMRRVVLEWADNIPTGCRITLREIA